MNKKIFTLREVHAAVLFGLIFAIFMSMANFDAECDTLRKNILRLHIIANSDSASDQSVKLAVRDAVLEHTSGIFEDGTDIEAAQGAVSKAIPELEGCADGILLENGFSYCAEAYLGSSYFETREYDGFTLPAGTYRSLIIKLGKGEGKNWWCVIFPAVCVPAAANRGELSDAVDVSSAEIAEHPKRYIMRFKTVEIYEDLKKLFSDK